MDYPTPLPLRIFELSTWVLLFFVIPAGVFGYFAEISNPGDGLYPVKRGIEAVVMRLESINNAAGAFYEIELASIRFKEASHVAIANNNTQALTDFNQQVIVAENAINALPDSPTKTKAKEQLLASITDYQEQLAQIHQNLGTTNLGTNTTTTTNISSPNASSQSDTSNTTSQDNEIAPTATPTPFAAATSNTSPITTEAPIPTPTPMRTGSSPTPIPTPTFVPTNTPIPQQGGDSSGGSTSSDQEANTEQAIQQAQDQLELARLRLLPTYTLNSSNPPPRYWMQNGGVVVFGNDGTWCYDNVGSFGSLIHQGLCEDGHSDELGKMILSHRSQDMCWPKVSQDDLVVYSCIARTIGTSHGNQLTQSVGCNNPVTNDEGNIVVNTNNTYCSQVFGHGSVCLNAVCTQVNSGQN